MVERIRCPRCSTVFPARANPRCPHCGLAGKVRPAPTSARRRPSVRRERVVVASVFVGMLLFAGLVAALVIDGPDDPPAGAGAPPDAAEGSGNGTVPDLIAGLQRLDNATAAPPATIIPVTDNATVGGAGPAGEAPPAISFRGGGDESTAPFETEQGLLRVAMTYRGDGLFSVTFRNLDDPDADRRALAAPQGDYDGARYLGLPPGRYVADVASGDGGGAWEVTIEQPRVEAPAPVPVQQTGRGDAADLAFEAAEGEVTFRTAHTAPYGEFVVRLYDANGNLVRRGGSEAVASDFGDHAEAVRVAIPADGVYFVDVQAVGDWSVEVFR